MESSASAQIVALMMFFMMQGCFETTLPKASPTETPAGSPTESVSVEQNWRVRGTLVSKHKAPFLFRWTKNESPIQAILWCAASKGELFNLGLCTSQDGWEQKTCVLKPYQPNTAMYPDTGFISSPLTKFGYWALDATTTYTFADDMKYADGVISVIPFGDVLYSHITLNATDPYVMHQRWTKKKGDTEGDAVLEGDYFRVLDEQGNPTKYWNNYIRTDEEKVFNVDTSFYNERMKELAQEFGVPEDEVWAKVWSIYAIDSNSGLKLESD